MIMTEEQNEYYSNHGYYEGFGDYIIITKGPDGEWHPEWNLPETFDTYEEAFKYMKDGFGGGLGEPDQWMDGEIAHNGEYIHRVVSAEDIFNDKDFE